MKKIALYNPYLQTKGGGEKVCLALAESLQNDLGCDVYLLSHSDVDLQELSDYFKIDLTGIKLVTVDFDTVFIKMLHRLPLPGKIRNIFFDRRVQTTVKRGNFDVFINNCYQSNLPSPIKHGVYMCMFPQRLDGSDPDISAIKKYYLKVAGLLSRLILHPSQKSPIDTYELITANSKYTQGYVEKLWHKDSEILYPICENMAQPSINKEKIILHVGRFFENVGESHHKRQDILLETFSKMTKLHKQGWELHLAGSVAEDAGALKYILQLMKEAQGLPVFFHFNCSFGELQKLFNQATVYWHATGFGSDPEKHPEKQEHFGITTVEAMSAGCIPIVINSAGQKESVKQAKNGYLWNNPRQLEDYTSRVATMPTAELAKLRDAARETAKQYDSAAFRVNVTEVFQKITN